MSDNPELSSKIKLDVTDFKTGITTANREIRVLESGFRVTAAGMGDWTKRSDGLTARLKMLTGVLNQQVDKVFLLEKEYKSVAREKGQNSKAAQELLIKLNKERESLAKVSKELDETDDRLRNFSKESKKAGKDVEDLGKKQDKTTKSTNKLGDALGKIGKFTAGAGKALLGLGTAAVMAAAMMGGIVLKSAQTADDLVVMSDVTGLSITKLQELKYIGDQVGVSTETMQSSFARLTKSMGAAKEGSGDQFDAFKALGIQIKDSSGHLRSSQDVYAETLNALGKMTNETERDVMAQQLLGKSAMELNPLLKLTADELQNMADKAKSSGAIMSEDSVRGLEAWGDKIDGLKNSLMGNLGTLAAGMLPALEPATQVLGIYMDRFTNIISGSGGNLTRAGPALGRLIGTMVTDAVKGLPDLLNAGLLILTGLIQGIVGKLPALVPVALKIIQMLIGFLQTNLPLLISAGIPILMSLITGIINMLPMIMQAAIQILMALVNGIAAQLPLLIPLAVQLIVMLVQGIATALPQLLEVAANLIPQVIIALIENLPLLIQAALQLILALVNGLAVAIPILIAYAPQIVEALVDAIEQTGPILVEVGGKILTALIDGIKAIWDQIKTTGSELITMFVDEFNRQKNLVLEVGSMLVAGVWEGIKAKADWLAGLVRGFFKGIVDAAKGALGIQSPSKVFGSIGQNMALGLGVGFKNSFAGIKRDVDKSLASLAGNQTMSLGVSGAGASGYGGGTSVVIHVNGTVNKPADINELANQVMVRFMRGA